MPALRKSARAPPHSLSNSTPYASPTGTPSESNGTGGKRQSLLTEWAEPIPQTLAPSFEEHGFARHGVLENMAPLGVPPSAKMKQRTRAMGETAARNAALSKGNAALFSDDIGSTPEVTPAPELEPDDSERQEEEEMQVDFPLQDEEEDDDYEPTKPTKKKAKMSKTPVRGKTPVQSKTPVQGKTPVKGVMSKSTSVSASPAVQAVQHGQLPPPANDESAQRIHTAVNDAILRANRSDRRQIGIALKEMWEESKINVKIADIMDAVIHNDCTNEQWHGFRTFIKASRKRQRNDAKWKRIQEERAGRRAATSVGHSQQPSPRASSEVIPDDSASAVNDAGDQEPSASKSMHSGIANAHGALQESIEQTSASAFAHPFNSAPSIMAANTSGEATTRMSSKSPHKKPATNGHLAPDTEMDVDGSLSTTAPTPAGKTPESGGASDSELSEVNEEIVQKGPPEPVQANNKAVSAAAAAAAKKIKSAAFARAAKKSKPNAGKLFGKHVYKQQQPTPEQLAEDERVNEARNELVRQQPIRRFDSDFQVSDVRFDDEINDTESLTESQIAVGPPVDSDQPRRAGRVPHHNAKRFREDASRFSSPLPESTAGTRPSTPAVGPAPKRIKLAHGNTARTKRS